MFGRSMVGHKLALGSVGLVLSLYFWEWYIYNFFAKPVLGYAIAFNIVFALAVWSYLATVFTDPGTMRCPEWQAWTDSRPPVDEAAERPDKDLNRHSWNAGRVTWCPECSVERPERAHHCSQCGLCVLRMDHHCPWIGNCLGWRNYKFFVLLNWWTFLACVLWLTTLRSPTAIEAMDTFMNRNDGGAGPAIAVLIAVVFGAVTGGMCAHALSMASRNVTTIEEFLPGRNPYDLDSSIENVTQVLGPLDFRLLLPLPPLGRHSGTSYPVHRPEPATAAGDGYGSC